MDVAIVPQLKDDMWKVGGSDIIPSQWPQQSILTRQPDEATPYPTES